MIVVLTGAGISQESGIATFRDSGGLWEQERIEDIATPRAFARNPQRVLRFYNLRRRELLNGTISPNAAHMALARLEKESSSPVLIITQNVDNLHERAGSQNILHMHGELLKARCTQCGQVFPWEQDLEFTALCPHNGCARSGTLRPHIVWFEEIPLYMEEIEQGLSRCKIFVSIGTSGNVYPAAGFSRIASLSGAQTIELNMEPSAGAMNFDEGHYGPATQVVTEWVNQQLLDSQA